MTAKEVKGRFCALACKVVHEKFKYEVAADCFCGASRLSPDEDPHYQFDEAVMIFIEEAVAEKMAVEKLVAEKLAAEAEKRAHDTPA